jgi:POT family proton-dependent oligopeptide transporter
MAHDNAVAFENAAPREQPSHTLRNFCISFGLQRHTFYVLKVVSVFYFTSVLTNYKTGQHFHNGFFAALSLAPVFIGMIVTTLPAQRSAVYLGQLLLFLAFVLLALDASRYLALILLIAGIGFFNISFKTVFAASMRRFDGQLDAHFTKLYVAINTGSFFAPLLVTYVFRYTPPPAPELPPPPPSSVFAWCGGCMLLSLYFWWEAVRGHNAVPLQIVDKAEKPPRTSGNPLGLLEFFMGLTPNERRSALKSIFGVLIVTLFSILFWLGVELKSGRLNIDAVSKMQPILLLGRPFHGITLQAINPLMVAFLAAPFAWAWQTLGKRDPHPVVKMSVGMFALGIGFIVLARGLSLSNGHSISAWWFIFLYVWHSIGEVFFEPIGQSFVIANVPDVTKGFFLALWEATAFLAFLGGDQASNLFGDRLYLILGLSALAAGALLLALTPLLKELSRR